MKQGILASATLLVLAWGTAANAQTYTRTDLVTYEDNLTLWVVGQPKTSFNDDTDLFESEIAYDPATALPTEVKAFGKVKVRATYHPDGTLASVSDDRDSPTFNTTVLYSGWT